ncbi:MAG: helix-turn-helix domain-containing protein [Hyphomicrobium sp.]|jgi:AraC-like DNA-binding protein
MAIAFSTDQVAQHDRIPYWVDIASKTFFRHGFTAKSTCFVGRLEGSKLDSLTLVQCECGPCEVTRTRSDISGDGVDDILLSIRLQGRSYFSQSDRNIVIEPGTLLLHDSARPMKMEFPEPTNSVILSMPRVMMQARIGDSRLGRVLSTNLPVPGITSDFLQAMLPRINAIEPASHTALAEQALGLISLAFAGSDSDRALSSTRAGALRRLKAEIDRRLSDPALKPAQAATAAGISVRYANLLLAEEGLSLERYIVDRRVENCRRALEDPHQDHRMIGEIAFAWGFSDHSHFTRRFRSVYGMTPGECREAARSRS